MSHAMRGGVAAHRRPPPDPAHALPVGRRRPARQEVVDHVDVPLDVHDLRHLTRSRAGRRRSTSSWSTTGSPASSSTPRRCGDRHLFRLGAGHDRVRVHVPPLAARHERGVGDRGGLPRPTTRSRRGEVAELDRAACRTRTTSLWLQTHLDADRAAAAGLLPRVARRVRRRRPSLPSLEGAATPIDDVESTCYGALRFRARRRRQRGASTPSTPRTPLQRRRCSIEAAWALVLAAFSGSTDVVFGSTRGCRRSGLPGSENVMGLFINTPPVRVHDRSGGARASTCSTPSRRSRSTSGPTSTPRCPTSRRSSETAAAALFDTIVVVNELHQGTRLKAARRAVRSTATSTSTTRRTSR